MIAFQMYGGGLSAVIRAVLITECLLTSVRGDGTDSTEKPEIKYALIGGGIGLFLAAGFIIFKFCIIRKHIRDYNKDGTMKRPLKTQMVHLGHSSQPEHPSDLQDDVNPANMATG
ncbi:transmembrane protein 273-like [Sander lucioperca]|uniref:transmembrane protein 273-like n=1 Tax=Sander lucioperca TaxID=283035 RepID=UPI00165353AB|nr:transmembrane protein 273-like [Sander lucioperca]